MKKRTDIAHKSENMKQNIKCHFCPVFSRPKDQHAENNIFIVMRQVDGKS